MKRNLVSKRTALIASIAALLSIQHTHAGTSWDGGGANTNIDTAANWDSDVVNALNGTTAATFGTGGSTATINTNASFTGIAINRDGNFAITDGAGALTVGTGGITVTLPTTTARTHTISESSLILNGSQSWTVTNNTGAAVLNVSSLVSGAFNLTKAGTGTLTLSGANTYTGTTTISAGTLSINTIGNVSGGASSLGTPTTVANGTIALNGTLSYTGAATATDRNFTFGGATSNITNASTTNGLLTLDGTIVVSSTNAFNLNPTGGNIQVNGVISGTGGNGLFMNGNGRTLTFANAGNSFNTTVNLFQGTLSIATISNAGTNSALGSGTNIVMGHNSFNMNPTLQFTGASGGSSSRPIFVQNLATGLGGGSIENTVAGQTLTLSGTVQGNTATGNPTLTLKGAGNGVLSGIISNNTAASLAITKSGAGTWALTNVNTYTGLTTVSGGTLRLGHATDTLDGAITVNGTGTLDVDNPDTVGAVTLTSGTISGDSTLTGTSYAVESGTVSTILGGAGALTKTTGGTVTLTGANTYSGATTISGGVLQLGNAGTTGALTGTTSITNNANLTINRSNAFTQATDLNGKVISGSGSFTQAGSGTTTLSLINTYGGTTTVNGGTLAVTGSLANNSSAHIVMAAPDDSLSGNPVLTRNVGAVSNAFAGFGSKVSSASMEPAIPNPPLTGTALQTTANILMSFGTNVEADTLSMQWRQRTAAEAAGSNPNAVLSDVIDITGMDNGSDIFVLEMSYTNAALTALGLNENSIAISGELRLGYKNGLNPTDWVSAAAGNTGVNGSNAVGANLNFQGSWAEFLTANPSLTSSNLDTYLGSRGVDVNTKTVWAIIDHNSEFAVIPEPSTLVLGGLALLGFAGVGLRRRRLVKQQA